MTITKAFDISELELLCADVRQDLADAGRAVNLDWDEIGGSSKEVRTQRLIDYLDRRHVLHYLVDNVRRVRPDILGAALDR